MFFDIPQGSVILFEDLSLMTQIIQIEPLNISEGLGEYRVYFTYPKARFSECVLKQTAYERKGIIGMWVHSQIYYANIGQGAFVPNFSFLTGESVKVIFAEDLGMSGIYSLSKSRLMNDYLDYEDEYPKSRKLTNKYRARPMGAPILKQIEAENPDSSHYRVYKAIKQLISSEPHKSYASWLAKNFLYNFY